MSFSRFERFIFGIFVFIFLSASFGLLWKINQTILVDVPKRGGTILEGLVGSPRFINPLLAVSDTDRDLSALIYSGLMRVGPDGQLIPDLAESYEVSETGRVYTFILRPDAQFHDGTTVTADDVVFTIQKAQDPALKSPRRATWEDITVAKIDSRTVSFTINKGPYSPFIENTTLGILPAHIWKEALPEEFVFSQFNIEPIGSGAYEVDTVTRNASGVPQQYKLKAFDDFTLGKPYIKNIVFHFYINEKGLIEGYTNGEIGNMASINASSAFELLQTRGFETTKIQQASLPRILGVFFNENDNKALARLEVRQALNEVLDKNDIINQALNGYGTVLNSPIPPGMIPSSTLSPVTESSETKEERFLRAEKILTDKGWEKNEEGVYEITISKEVVTLTFSLATSDTEEFKQVTNIIAETWNELGAKVDVQIFEGSDLNQNVIRPRKYDALFFGQVIGRDLDFFGFWHSSQRNDPGLNIAMYTNITADKLLEEARTVQEREERLKKYALFEKEVINDVPAVFIYSPDFIYVISEKIKGLSLEQIITPADRFANAYLWYVDTDRVWSIFAK